MHRDQDIDALAARLKSEPGPRVWLSYAPPRLTDNDGSDLLSAPPTPIPTPPMPW